MTLPNRQFGVELEYTGCARNVLRRVFAENSIDCSEDSRIQLDKWAVVYDGSVTDAELHGGEVVSPILCGDDGIASIKRILDLIKENLGRVDKSCGFHVHVNAKDLSIEELKFVVYRYERFQASIDMFMKENRRSDRYNNYCGKYGKDIEDVRYLDSLEQLSEIDRYYNINIAAYEKYGTVEFRQYCGTLNFEEIKNWIIFCVSFVEESKRLYNELKGKIKPINETNVLNVKRDDVEPSFPIDICDQQSADKIKLTNRRNLRFLHFKQIPESSRKNKFSRECVRYTLLALVEGVDFDNFGVYVYSKSTTLKTISFLRKFGFKIELKKKFDSECHESKYYILSDVQDSKVFNKKLLVKLFKDEVIFDGIPKYKKDTEDRLFNGMSREVRLFFKDKVESLKKEEEEKCENSVLKSK